MRWTHILTPKEKSMKTKLSDLNMVQPNAGPPKLVNMKVVYDETPEQMVTGVVPLLDAGAAIIGGCCGGTPAHIRAFRHAMDAYFHAKGKIHENQAV
jgi:methionine synthase I (cobalamin-dependent)